MSGDVLKKLYRGLIVSCQALPGEPLYDAEKSIMHLMARAAEKAGAKGIRTSGLRDVAAIKEETPLPVIGLIKKQYEGYDAFITPTMKEVDQLAAAGADIIAVDATCRRRGDQRCAPQFLAAIKEKYPKVPLMADISTFEEGVQAWEAGADLVGTTMSGYTGYSPQLLGPDFDLVERLAGRLPIPVIAEGRIHSPEQAKKMLELGAYAVVVGGAITRPYEIAVRFVEGMKRE